MIGICVWSDDDVREVVAGEQGVLAGCRPNTVIAIHSTVLAATVRDLAALAAQAGAYVVDAPVSGGRKVALTGFLTLAVGGDEEALARCRPVFDAFAGEVVRLGDVGAGQIAKLLNNTLFAANLAVADDALTLGAALGVDAGALAQFLTAGSGRSYGLDVAQMCRASEPARHCRAARAAEGRRSPHRRGRRARHRRHAAPRRGGSCPRSPAGSTAGMAIVARIILDRPRARPRKGTS